MSNIFRELLKKVGSGVHTHEDLTREEALIATKMMLDQVATPAQIGAFMIAHRIKRPTPAELAGMLDAYQQLGPIINTSFEQYVQPVWIFGNPYDGRSRTAPVTIITALILSTAGIPVLLHGGDTIPTKYGLPLIEIWQGLGIDFSKLSLGDVEKLLETVGISFIYLPQHFTQAHDLVTYRDQIGKRPPFATVELIWSPSVHNIHLVAGFVHPPTEDLFRETLDLVGCQRFTTIKGLEGSCDLPRSRTAIIGYNHPDTGFERILLHPHDYGFQSSDIPLESTTELIEAYHQILEGKSCELMKTAIWNGGFYLWHSGICSDINAGFAKAEELLITRKVANKLKELATFMEKF